MRNLLKTAWALLAVLLVATSSCSEPLGPEDTAVAIEIVAGDNQASRVGAFLDDPIVVRVTNRSGKGVRGAAVLFKPDSGSGSTDPLVATTDSTGVASVNWRLGTSLGAMRIVASFADLTPATITATAVPDRFDVVSGDLQAARVTGTLPLPLVVKVTDYLGRAVPGISVTFTADAGSGSVAPALIATDAQGLARSNWTLGTATGAMRVVATVATAPNVEFRAVANQDILGLAAGGDQGARAGTTLPRALQVRVVDQNGAVIPNVIVNFAPGAGSGSVNPASAQSNALGIATANWTLGATPGPQTLSVSSSFASTITVNATALDPADIELVSGDQQIARVKTQLPTELVVEVTDATGRSVPGAVVRFVPDAGDGSVNAEFVTTDTLGQARARWTLGEFVGQMQLRAISGTDTLQFTATTTADLLQATSGSVQTGPVGLALGTPLTTTVRDLAGAVVAGVVVTFTPDAGSGSVSPSSVTTDASGVARTLWTLGALPGDMRVVASAPTAALAVEFTATAVALLDTRRVISVFSGDVQAAQTGAAFASPLVVRLVDGAGNPVAGQAVNWTSANLTLGASASSTNANGEASVTVRAGTTVGDARATATIAGRQEAVTFGLTSQTALTSVWAGNYFSCGLAERGEAYCWGFNQNKQLGNSDTATFTNAPSLPLQAGSQIPIFRKIDGGENHGCGITVARQLMCWGLGQGSFGTSAPTVVNIANASIVEDVSVGSGHTCIVEAGGFAICVGDNQRGQLGVGTLASNASPFVAVPGLYSTVSAGGLHSCGFERGTGDLYCWGDNQQGQLGINTTSSRDSLPLRVGAAIVWDSTSLVLGASHSCALNVVGQAYCWGANAYGQLGNGATALSRSPVLVSGGLTFTRLVAGRDHSCGITAAGAAYCWGRNTAGQLGDGTSVNRLVPTTVAGGIVFRALTAGEFHSCGVQTPGTGTSGTLAPRGVVFCWGDSEYGQAGTGQFRSNASPILVPTRVVFQP